MSIDGTARSFLCLTVIYEYIYIHTNMHTDIYISVRHNKLFNNIIYKCLQMILLKASCVYLYSFFNLGARWG